MNNTSFTPPYTDPAIALQQMYELDAIQWQGGENHFDGPHDQFCFLCASPNTSTSSLFSCSTCENCYHAECMTPSLSPDDVPRFWFCPHCVERGNHVPDLGADDGVGGMENGGDGGMGEMGGEMIETNCVGGVQGLDGGAGGELGEKSQGMDDHVHRSDKSAEHGQNQVSMITPPQETQSEERYRVPASGYHEQLMHLDEQQRQKEPAQYASMYAREFEMGPKSVSKPSPPTQATAPPSTQTQTQQPSTSRKRSPPPTTTTSTKTNMPPKKKSKYSTLPSALEKALFLITSELEKSCSSMDSTSSLQTQITTLEQKIRMMDGQMALKDKELKQARQANEVLKREKDELRIFRQENHLLKREVEKKEAELREWKEKLKGLVAD